MEACFTAFDRDGDHSLNINEFSALLKSIFRDEKGKPYPVDSSICNEIFMIFNQSGDGSMSKQEFSFCWKNWIKKIVRPVSAFIVVDVQNDFISGSLSIAKFGAGHDGEDVIEPINKLLDTVPFNIYVYSLDWHPDDHLSFVENVCCRKLHKSSKITDATKAVVSDVVVFEGPPTTEQVLWPKHCVQESWGAELHKELKVPDDAVFVHKGNNSNLDSYSAFFDNKKLGHTKLESKLKEQGITDVFVCGLAYDVCVGATALHAQELGYRTILIDDCSRGINPEDIDSTIKKIKEDNGLVIHSSEVKTMVQGKDRRVNLGYQWALQCRKQIFYPPKNKNSRHNIVPATNQQEMGHVAEAGVQQNSALVASA